jgi:hypothetical protein
MQLHKISDEFLIKYLRENIAIDKFIKDLEKKSTPVEDRLELINNAKSEESLRPKTVQLLRRVVLDRASLPRGYKDEISVNFARDLIYRQTKEVNESFRLVSSKIRKKDIAAVARAKKIGQKVFERAFAEAFADRDIALIEAPGILYDVLSPEKFQEYTSRGYSRLFGNELALNACARTMESARAKIIRNNMKTYGQPSLDGSNYNCNIELQFFNNCPRAVIAEIQAGLLAWQALAAPTLCGNPINIKMRIGSDRADGSGFYHDKKKVVYIGGVSKRLGRAKRRVYHELTHALEDVCPGVSRANTVTLLERAKGKENPVQFTQLYQSDGVFYIPDAFCYGYTGRIYVSGQEGVLVSDTRSEISATSVEDFFSGPQMLALYMTDRDLFYHAMAIFSGAYNE